MPQRRINHQGLEKLKLYEVMKYSIAGERSKLAREWKL
jgi:hypothetical protein